MNKPTPAPWSVKSVDWDSEGDVRYTLDGIKHFSAPHKNLIEAAPDLLEALEDIVADFGVCGMTEKAIAAIAKATGETP